MWVCICSLTGYIDKFTQSFWLNFCFAPYPWVWQKSVCLELHVKCLFLLWPEMWVNFSDFCRMSVIWLFPRTMRRNQKLICSAAWGEDLSLLDLQNMLVDFHWAPLEVPVTTTGNRTKLWHSHCRMLQTFFQLKHLLTGDVVWRLFLLVGSRNLQKQSI